MTTSTMIRISSQIDIVDRKRAFHTLRELWQNGLDSLNLGSAKDWFLPVLSHSPSSPGDYARSGRTL
jgi:hypothetical protein